MSLFDTFPPRNLAPESSEWGREVETRILDLATGNNTGSQSVTALNRTTAASLEDIAGQVRRLDEQIQRIDDAYAALPTPVQTLANPVNFGVSVSGSWNTIATATLTAPKAGRLRVSVIGTGMLRSPSTSTNMELTARVSLDTLNSPTVPGNFESPDGMWRNSFYVPWGWDVGPISAGQVVTFRIEVNPVDASSWPSGWGSYAVLSINGAIST